EAPFLKIAKCLLDAQEDKRAKERAPESSASADIGDRQYLDGSADAENFGRRLEDSDIVRVESAHQSHQARSDRKVQQLVTDNPKSEGAGSELVITDRLKDEPNVRGHNGTQHEVDQADDNKQQKIYVKGVFAGKRNPE